VHSLCPTLSGTKIVGQRSEPQAKPTISTPLVTRRLLLVPQEVCPRRCQTHLLLRATQDSSTSSTLPQNKDSLPLLAEKTTLATLYSEGGYRLPLAPYGETIRLRETPRSHRVLLHDLHPLGCVRQLMVQQASSCCTSTRNFGQRGAIPGDFSPDILLILLAICGLGTAGVWGPIFLL
jgi:hypothetical protein